MNVVAGRAGESRGLLEASAASKKLHLISMNVDGLLGGDVGDIDEVTQIVPGKERQSGSDRRAIAGVAEAADVDLAVAVQLGGIHDGFRCSGWQMRFDAMQCNVCSAGAVAFLADDSQHQRSFPV